MLTRESLEFSAPIRCYNGAFDSTSQRVLNAQAAALSAIRKIEPEAHVTYHAGLGGGHVVHVWGRELSAYAATRGTALFDACNKLGVSL